MTHNDRMAIMVIKAEAFARERHAGQKRKYTGEPYATHLEGVVKILKSVEHTPAMLASAWLHDSVEGRAVKYSEINGFPPPVPAYVKALTDDVLFSTDSRAVRKQIYRNQLEASPSCVQTIKLADMIDNCSTLMARDPKFAVTYFAEQRLMLAALKDGDAGLRERLRMILGGEDGNE